MGGQSCHPQDADSVWLMQYRKLVTSLFHCLYQAVYLILIPLISAFQHSILQVLRLPVFHPSKETSVSGPVYYYYLSVVMQYPKPGLLPLLSVRELH